MMRNRYVIVIFHWLSSLLLGATLIGLVTGNSNPFTSGFVETFAVAISFGGVFASPFLLISFFSIPVMLKIQRRNKRILVVTFYTVACFIVSIVLLHIIGLVELMEWWKDPFFRAVGASFLFASTVSAFIWSALYEPRKLASIEVIKGTLDAHLGLSDKE